MDEVTVDRKTLKALGADSRIAILKNLARKRMTQAELADALGMAAPSVNEHLRQLQSASLIAQFDEGRKWKYYEITQKGRLIVQPTNVKVWFLLAISLLALVLSFWQIYPAISSPLQLQIRPTQTADQVDIAASINAVQEARIEAYRPLPGNTSEPEPAWLRGKPSLINTLPLVETAVFLASLLFLGASAAMLLKKD